MKKPLFKEALFCFILVIILDQIARTYDLYYWSVGWEFDSFMHFLGGLTAGLGVLWFYFFSGFFTPSLRTRKNFFLIGFLGIVFVGVTWEIYELVIGTTFATDTQYPFDTFLDIVFDIMGTFVACIYGFNKEKKLNSTWQN